MDFEEQFIEPEQTVSLPVMLPAMQIEAAEETLAKAAENRVSLPVLFLPRATETAMPADQRVFDFESIPAIESDGLSSKQRSEHQLEKARRRQELYLQKRRDKKKRQIVYNRLRGLLRIAFSVMLIACLDLTATAPYWQFDARHFTLQGQHLLQRAQLQPYMQTLQHQPIYKINPLALEKTIQHDIPLVGQVYIRRQLYPVSLAITVVEKPYWGAVYTTPPTTPDVSESSTALTPDQPVPTIPTPEYLIHWDGTATNLSVYHPDAQTMQQVQQAIPLVAQGHFALNPQTVTTYRDIASLLNSRPKAAKLRYLDITDSLNLLAVFDTFRVNLGHADRTLMARTARLFDVIPAIESRTPEIAMVDLRWNQQVILKKKSKDQIALEKKQAELQVKLKAKLDKLKLKKLN